MITEEFKKIKSGKKELRNFGLVMAAALIILDLLILWRRGEFYYIIAAFAMVFLGLSFRGHFILKPLYRVWMALSIILGRITNAIILTLLFYIVLLPTGFAVKLSKGDFIGLKFNKKKDSYWEVKTKIAEAKGYYEKQF